MRSTGENFTGKRDKASSIFRLAKLQVKTIVIAARYSGFLIFKPCPFYDRFMTAGLKQDIVPFSEVIDPKIDRIPTGNMANLLNVTRRHLRKLIKALRDCEIEGFDHEPWQKRFNRESAEILWEFHQRIKLDGFEVALMQMAGIDE